ncbi:MAG: CDP-diacylglycerol--serine O-phosphatidyltransferase [Rhodospirillales bacterium]
MFRPSARRRRLRRLSFNKMLPNIMTLGALAAGMTAIRFALQDRFEFAAMAIAVAAILDGLDGRIARLLKGTSKFGAELDSLSDFIAFGVAPPMVLYLWAFQEYSRFGWIFSLIFAMCCALRLARFNCALDDPNTPPWAGAYFTGVPSPAGAGLVMLPLILHLQIEADVFREPVLVCLFELGVGALLVSPIRTFSFKRIRVGRKFILPLMLVIGLLLALILSTPWLALSLVLFAYLISIPFGHRAYQTQLNRWEAAHAGEAEVQANEAPPVANPPAP